MEGECINLEKETNEKINVQKTIEQIKISNQKKYKRERIIRGTIFAILWIAIAAISYIAYYFADKEEAINSNSNVTTSVNEESINIEE